MMLQRSRELALSWSMELGMRLRTLSLRLSKIWNHEESMGR